jgi:hypothetical protein
MSIFGTHNSDPAASETMGMIRSIENGVYDSGDDESYVTKELKFMDGNIELMPLAGSISKFEWGDAENIICGTSKCTTDVWLYPEVTHNEAYAIDSTPQTKVIRGGCWEQNPPRNRFALDFRPFTLTNQYVVREVDCSGLVWSVAGYTASSWNASTMNSVGYNPEAAKYYDSNGTELVWGTDITVNIVGTIFPRSSLGANLRGKVFVEFNTSEVAYTLMNFYPVGSNKLQQVKIEGFVPSASLGFNCNVTGMVTWLQKDFGTDFDSYITTIANDVTALSDADLGVAQNVLQSIADAIINFDINDFVDQAAVIAEKVLNVVSSVANIFNTVVLVIGALGELETTFGDDAVQPTQILQNIRHTKDANQLDRVALTDVLTATDLSKSIIRFHEKKDEEDTMIMEVQYVEWDNENDKPMVRKPVFYALGLRGGTGRLEYQNDGEEIPTHPFHVSYLCPRKVDVISEYFAPKLSSGDINGALNALRDDCDVLPSIED